MRPARGGTLAGIASGRAATMALPAVLAVLAVLASPVSAHPLDRLIQRMEFRVAPGSVEVEDGLGGGLLANERVLNEIDANHDGHITPEEARAWAAHNFLGEVEVTLDGRPVPLTVDDLTLSVPDEKSFHLGLKLIVITFRVPLPAAKAPTAHQLQIRNDYLIDRTDYRVAATAASGATITSQPLASHIERIDFRVPPGAANDRGAGDTATVWGGEGIIMRAQHALERPKTPLLLVSLVGIFLVMGALHALQPGHGKTLVAAYLVATGGTPRDAMALAGIVTFTHTISVFALALATLAASQFFLPARVVPVLGVVSGLLVVGMGANMLRVSIRRTRGAAHAHPHPHPHEHHHHDHEYQHSHDYEHAHSHDHAHPHPHPPSPIPHPPHDHGGLSDEEHARLHLAEIERARGNGRGVELRSLVTLGVSGGLAPCPDALAILLLAVGINQLALGMLAIVAFSLGLAGVLVAFGLAIALAGPFWRRLRRVQAASGRLGVAAGRVVALSPVLSAVVVLLLGLAMLWRSTGLGL